MIAHNRTNRSKDESFLAHARWIPILASVLRHILEENFNLREPTSRVYPQRHLLASVAIATFSLFFSQKTPFLAIELFGFDFTIFALCIIFGVFLDLDHMLDYRLNRQRPYERLESRFREGRMFVVFHGIENIIILIVISIAFPFLIFPTASYSCHLAMDIYSNDVSFQAYFYTIRFARKLFTR